MRRICNSAGASGLSGAKVRTSETWSSLMRDKGNRGAVRHEAISILLTFSSPVLFNEELVVGQFIDDLALS